MTQERLQKILAQAGVASRRAAEGLITDGRVRVNGRIVRELGTKADSHKDKIEVNGKRIVAEKPAYYVINKPREVVTTLDDPEGRETIGQLLRRVPERVYPIGRLDYHTSGVLLVTNDGDMAQALLHPRKAVPKTYVVKLRGNIDVPELDALRNGVDIGDQRPTGKAEVFVVREDRDNTWIQITITEGRNRQIHRMLEAIGMRVQRMSRIAFAGIEVEGLTPGQWRPINATELRKLKRDYLNPDKRAKEEAAEEAAAAGPLGPRPSRPGKGKPGGRRKKSAPEAPADAPGGTTKFAPRPTKKKAVGTQRSAAGPQKKAASGKRTIAARPAKTRSASKKKAPASGRKSAAKTRR